MAFPEWYGNWALQGSPDILGNEYIGIVDELRMPKILTRMAQGSACFDISFYRRENEVIATCIPAGPSKLSYHESMAES